MMADRMVETMVAVWVDNLACCSAALMVHLMVANLVVWMVECLVDCLADM